MTNDHTQSDLTPEQVTQRVPAEVLAEVADLTELAKTVHVAATQLGSRYAKLDWSMHLDDWTDLPDAPGDLDVQLTRDMGYDELTAWVAACAALLSAALGEGSIYADSLLERYGIPLPERVIREAAA